MARTHLEDSIDQHPHLKAALIILCGTVKASGGTDLECDMSFDGKQYHIEVSEVAELQTNPEEGKSNGSN